MTIYTSSTIPLNGGTINNSTDTMAWAPLGSDKYIMIYQQYAPNHVFAQIVTTNGLSSPIAGPNCLVRENFDYSSNQPQVRVYGNDEGTKALIVYLSTSNILSYQFLNIDSSDFITPVSQATTTIVSSISSFMCEKVSNTNFFYAYKTTGSSNRYGSATIDWVNNVFTFGSALSSISFTSSTFLTNATRVYPIPGSSKTFVWTGGVVILVDSNGDISSTYNATQVTGWGLPSGSIIPLSETRFLGISSSSNQRNVKLVDAGTAGQAFTITSTAGTNLGDLTLAIPLDVNRYMVMCHTTSATSNLSMMVCRIMGQNVGSVSPNTDLPGGLTATMSGVSGDRSFATAGNRYHPSYHRKDFSTVVYWAVSENSSSTAKLAFKIINQPT